MLQKKTLKPKGSKEIVKSASGLPADFTNMSQLSGAGAEDIGIEDLPRPSVKLLHPMSPPCTIGGEEFREDAKPGMFLNAGNGRLYSGEIEELDNNPPLIFIPVKYTKREVEYQRGRGGFVAEHMPSSSITEGLTVVLDDKGKPHRITTNDTELVDTSIYYGLVIDPDTFEPLQAIISLSNTGKKFAKDFNAFMKGLVDSDPNGIPYKPALFSRVYTLYSVITSGKNEPYWAWKFKLHTILNLEANNHKGLIAAAFEYLQLINADQVNVQHSVD